MATRLVVLVPGYEIAAKRNDALNSLREGLSANSDDATISSVTRGNAAGWAVNLGQHSVEMYEAFWQDQVQMLSDNKLYIRILTGLWTSILWLNPKTLSILRHSFMWLLATISGSLLLALWLYGGIAVLLVSIGNLVPSSTSMPMPSGPSVDLHSFLQSHIGDLGVQMQKFWLWAWASIIVTVLGIRLDAFANILDLVRRFVTDSLDGPVTNREKLGRVVKHTVAGLAKATDERTIVIAQSFGVLIAMEAIAEDLATPVEFVSFGSFLAFLSAEFKRVSGDITRCVQADCLTRWEDFYSADDWYAGPLPVPEGTDKVTSQVITGYVPFYKRFLATAHENYYNNPDAMKRLAAILSRD